jgi:hypothetical protein
MPTLEQAVQAAVSRPAVPRYVESADLNAVVHWLWRRLNSVVSVAGLEVESFAMKFELDLVTPGQCQSFERMAEDTVDASTFLSASSRRHGFDAQGTVYAAVQPSYEGALLTGFRVQVIAPHVAWLVTFVRKGDRLLRPGAIEFHAGRRDGSSELPN